MDSVHELSDSCLGVVQVGSQACEKGPILCMAPVCSLLGPDDCHDLKLHEHVLQSGIWQFTGWLMG